ncbi:MAG: HAMP domain-containing histidine kinase [Oscillospiraceae bacterium]|nr:HAMP domain-containing histidine kinase [Oscillospiraceae bacterium]
MKGRLVSVTVLFSVLIIIAASIFYISEKQADPQDNRSEQLVAVNEIEQLVKKGEYEKLPEKTAELSESIRSSEAVSNVNIGIFIMCGICIVFCAVIFIYVYFAILRPFDKLKGFAEKISQGNFDIPLDYERSNYFGEFTWAFDSMRREIKKARSCEREAIENNKTVIATLSHDIKTPIASIRAYAEGLEANLDGTPEKRKKYIGVIMKKCDEVSRLTNDLFLHSLSDMDKLKISSERFELCGFIENAVTEIAAEFNDVHFQKPDFTAAVNADKNRLMQITENLIVNARKYAKTDIDVFITLSGGNVLIHFRDFGKGIPDEDMPFIFEKFYRGKNCGSEQGSGLGLYIVKYITEQMDGYILLKNHNDGLEAIVSLPIS